MKSSKIIDKRNNISREITNYWKIIKTENVVKKGYTRSYNLKQVFEAILKDAEKRINYKLMLQCINMGLHSLKELSSNNNYKNVFILSELEERKVQLGLIKTIDPAKKKAIGKHALKETEELTSDWIKERMKEIELSIIKYKSLIEKFNDSIDFEDELEVK